MSERPETEGVAGEDDAWLAELRQAMASGEAGSAPRREADQPATADLNGSEAPANGSSHGIASVRDAVRYLGVRTATVESLVEDIARSVRRLSDAPSTVEIEQVVTRVVRAELPALLDETLARWAERAEAGEVPSGDVVLQVHELRQRVGQLEELQRQAHEQLAADRKALIDDAVSQIRTLLFGQ